MDIQNHFKQFGVLAAPLDGAERLRIHSVFRMDTQDTFRFSWDWLSI